MRSGKLGVKLLSFMYTALCRPREIDVFCFLFLGREYYTDIDTENLGYLRIGHLHLSFY
jgi:hypothetical protein